MKVSICCSVLNQKDMLKDMIASVVKQTYSDWELVLIDDGSTDDIKAVVDEFNDARITLERLPDNHGVPFGMNLAFTKAQGEYAQSLSADEVLDANKLELQVEYLDAHPAVDMVCGMPQFYQGQQFLDTGERPLYEMNLMRSHNRSRESWLRTLLELDSVPLGSCSCLYRRRVFDSIGHFDPTLKTFSDHEWFVRFFKARLTCVMLPYRWALSRPHEGTVREENPERNTAEIEYVRNKHVIDFPVTQNKVTVCMPIYNMAHFMRASLDSILNQTYKNIEVLVMDDCSTDNIANTIIFYDNPRIKYFRMEENIGTHAVCNQGLARAEGEFFTTVAADDVLDPQFIEKCLAEFSEHPFTELVASQTDFIDEKGEPFKDKSHPFHSIEKAANKPREQWLQRLYHGNVYFGAGMYRTAALKDVGGWSPEFEVITDYEMYLKLLQRENIRIVEEDLTHTRIHGANQSLLKPAKAATLKHLYSKAKAPYFKKNMKLIIATPFYELKGFSPYISSLVATVKTLTQMGIEHEFWELSGDSYVHRARNTLCTKFLEDPDATDLFFIDSDMSWNVEGFLSMLILPDEVIGASYPTKNKYDSWTSIPIFGQDQDKTHPIGKQLGPEKFLLNAQFLSAGFLRMKRSALEKYRDHYTEHRYKEPCADPSNPDREYIEFFASIRQDGLLYGEDMMFSKRLREMGLDMWIYPDVTMGHFGTKGWTGNYHQHLKGNTKTQDNTMESVN